LKSKLALFETERLCCRRWAARDLAALLAVYGDVEAMRWVGDGQPLSEAAARRWLTVTHDNYVRRGYGMFALEERQRAGDVIGFCGLVHPGGQAEAEVKYALRRTHWGQGLATEAVRGLLAYGAARHGLVTIIATVAPDNVASLRVLAKAGLTPERLRTNDDGTRTHVLVWRAPGPTGGPA
jgi:ribosomal-protein-alanine N-acetyltransferase